jgi:hypothetical protein
MQFAVAVHVLAVLGAMRVSVIMRMGVLVRMSMGMRMRVVQVAVPVPVLVLMSVAMRVLVLVTVLVITLGGAIVWHMRLLMGRAEKLKARPRLSSLQGMACEVPI